MSKRLGNGEFERADVEVRQSTLVARHKFLEILDKRKGNCLFELVRLFDFNFVPTEFLDKERIDNTVYFFLHYLLSKKPYETEIRANIIDTPLINYYSFLFDHEDEIKQLENDENFQKLTLPNSAARRNKAIGKIVGNWKDLKNRDEAKAFCLTLENWAKSYNLREDWILDFALKVLSRFKSEFDSEIARFKRMPVTDITISWFITAYEMESRNSIRKGIYDYYHNEIWSNQWEGFDDLAELPAFNYRWRDFELTSETWLARMTTRKQFIAIMNEKLDKTIESIRRLETRFPQSTEAELADLVKQCRSYLENYCDDIEKQKAENIDVSNFAPIAIEEIGTFAWIHSEQDRVQFIEKTCAEFETRIKKNNEAIKSLKTFTKGHFEAELTKYCNDIEKFLPKEWVRTPMKYSDDKHFEWLVDFQVEPVRGYTEIARENNIKARKTVREAVEELARQISISLRQSKRTGRPKGTKNSPNSNRQLGIFKK
ncbi:MAG TPA: hypothetical protein VGB02_10425 [Pyrinomonadaceae bacterium]|jgi:hypothetical protein